MKKTMMLATLLGAATAADATAMLDQSTDRTDASIGPSAVFGVKSSVAQTFTAGAAGTLNTGGVEGTDAVYTGSQADQAPYWLPGFVAADPRASRNVQFRTSVDADVAAVPEPATWAMMLFGFSGLRYVLRRRAATGPRVRFA